MRVMSRASAVLLSLAVMATACGPRQVEVRTAPTTTAATEQAVQVTNNLSQAVNVYVTGASNSEMFLKQVAANTSEKVPVQGIASGSTVTFKAVTVDGSRTYQSRNVTLSGLFIWSIP
jgi:ABC-type glycerol-3-phosphate transport system substrate-binding protein